MDDVLDIDHLNESDVNRRHSGCLHPLLAIPALQTIRETGPNQGHCLEFRKIVFETCSLATVLPLRSLTRMPLRSKFIQTSVPSVNFPVSLEPERR